MKTKTQKSNRKRVEISFSEADLLKSVTGFVEQVKTGAAKNLRITDVAVPPRLPARSAADVRRVRESLGVSQAVFAAFLNVPARTVVSWENSQRQPSGAALKLLDIAERHPEVLTTAAAKPAESITLD